MHSNLESSEKKFKVLLLTTQMEEAGAQKALLSLARGLTDRGHHASVAVLYDKAEYVPVFSRRYRLPIQDLEMKRPCAKTPLHKIVYPLRGLWRLFRSMKREHFDVLQTFGHYSNIIGPPIAWLAGVPIRISSQRNSLRAASKWLWRLDRLVANSFLVEKMTAVSKATLRFCVDVEGIRRDKLLTIYNGIDVKEYTPVGNRDALRAELRLKSRVPLILVVARLHRQKGHRYLIEAIPTILASAPDVHFVFAGEGELRQELQNLVEQKALSGCVHFLGVRQDIPYLLASCDLFVLPSLWEGMPNSVLEAMAGGIPIVSTNVDGCAEVLEDGVTGVFVPPADPVALSAAVIRLLKDKEFRHQLAVNARKKVEERFSAEATTQKYIDLYYDLLNER